MHPGAASHSLYAVHLHVLQGIVQNLKMVYARRALNSREYPGRPLPAVLAIPLKVVVVEK